MVKSNVSKRIGGKKEYIINRRTLKESMIYKWMAICLYMAGEDMNVIAYKTGIQSQTLYKAMKVIGIPLRGFPYRYKHKKK